MKGLIKVLQSTQEQQLWGYEEATLDQPHLESTITMTALTESILQAIIFESDLRVGLLPLSPSIEHSSSHPQPVLDTQMIWLRRCDSCDPLMLWYARRPLQERWGNEALSWAVGCSSRHLSARSLQVFRALKLPLASNSADCLLYSLHLVISKAAKAKEPMAALECALEIILTLQVPCRLPADLHVPGRQP